MQAETALRHSQRTKIEDFISQAIACLSSEHPNWTNSSNNQSTICVPPYFETVRRNLESESLAVDKKGNRGDVSEQKIFDALKKLYTGTIVVANVDSTDIEKHARIVWKEYRIAASGMTGNDGKHDFQCDFIIFHWTVGIIIIEVKSTEGNDKNLPQDAVKKFKKTIAKVKLLLKVIAGEDCGQIPIKAVLTSPNLKLTANYSIQTNEEYLMDFIDSTTDQMLSEYLVELQVDAISLRQNFADCTEFRSIVAFFCCYRRALYLNEILNAVEVANLIDGQNLRPRQRKMTKRLNRSLSILDNISQIENLSSAIFLTVEQKSIVDSSEKCQLVFGPPGTGKTLVLIAKLLKTMQENSTNRLVVLSYQHYASCKEKLKKITSAAPPPNRYRTPVFLGDHEDVDDSDDVYCDECTTEMIPFLIRRRQSAEGSTFAIFTGTFHVREYKKYKSDVESLLTNFTIHYLEKIMRGTKNIVEYWTKEMNISSDDFIIGHGIKGPTVSPPQLHSTFHATLTAVCNQVQWLINNGAQPNHIAVINDDEEETLIVAEFLKSNGISTVSSILLLTDQNAIVVDYDENVYSMEWPFVIVCSLTCIDQEESFLLIACSRAIAHLTVISFDYHSMQQYVENQLKIPRKRKLSGRRKFYKRIRTASLSYLKEGNEMIENKGLLNSCIYTQFAISMLRRNIVTTPSKKRPAIFQDCQRITDCLQIIAQNKDWMERFVEKYYGLVADDVRESQLEIIRDYFKDYGFKFTATFQSRFYKQALLTMPEYFLILRDFQNKFAAEATLHFLRNTIKSEKTDVKSINFTETSDTDEWIDTLDTDDGSELFEEIILLMNPLVECYPELTYAKDCQNE